jgi:hypothetical protein
VTLTVADIDRWNAGAVREVFQAATARGQATLDASRQLSSLAVFDTWEGATAEARKHANANTRLDFDAHGNEALAVARAADQAADGIEHVQSELRALRRDAGELHMAIDAMTNLQQLHVSNPNAHLSLFGHSYGSPDGLAGPAATQCAGFASGQ